MYVYKYMYTCLIGIVYEYVNDYRQQSYCGVDLVRQINYFRSIPPISHIAEIMDDEHFVKTPTGTLNAIVFHLRSAAPAASCSFSLSFSPFLSFSLYSLSFFSLFSLFFSLFSPLSLSSLFSLLPLFLLFFPFGGSSIYQPSRR